jgi:hypothetical protein
MHQHFVGANILSAPIFCWCQYFVDATILLMQKYCRRKNFVGANILSPTTFVAANILLAVPIFCQRQYFVRKVWEKSADVFSARP